METEDGLVHCDFFKIEKMFLKNQEICVFDEIEEYVNTFKDIHTKLTVYVIKKWFELDLPDELISVILIKLRIKNGEGVTNKVIKQSNNKLITIEEMRKCLPEKKRRFMDKLFAGLEHWKFMIKEIRMDDSRITIFVSGVPLFIGNVRSGIHPSLKMIQEGVTKFYFPKKMVRIICSLD